MFRFRRATAVVVVTTLAMSTACYNQVSVGLTTPVPETRVVVGITDIGADRLANSIGVAAREVEGIFVGAVDSVWTLRVLRVDQLGGMSTTWSGEQVAFPRSALTNVRERRLNRTNSWLAAGGVVALSLLLARAAGSILGDDGNNPPIVDPGLRFSR